jgi:hypothetical protein
MADAKITIETEIKGNASDQIEKAAKATGSLRQELKQLTLELQGLEPGSARFQELTQRAGELKDQIADTNAAIEATAGAPIENLGKGIAGVASIGIRGFQGLVSAQALFGSESKALQETMVKLQAVAGMAEAIEALGSMGDTITNVKASFGSFVNAAKAGLTGIKGAVAATGLGLLLIAVGTLVAYWDDIKGAMTGVSAEQERLNMLAEANVNAENRKMEALNQSDNILRLQGLSEKEILQLKLKQVDAQIKALENQIEQGRITFKSQYEAEKRNREILKGILMFTQAPLLLILKTIDEIANFAGFDSNLAEGLLDWESSFLFDEGKVKENYDKTYNEQKKTLLKLQNDRAGFELDIQKIDKQAAEERARIAKENLANAKDNDAARLAAKRELEDANLALMDDTVEKELLANKYKYERLIEDTKLDEKKTAAEKLAINAAYAKEKDQQDLAIKEDWLKKAEEIKKAEEEKAAEKKRAEREARDAKYDADKVIRDKEIALMAEGIEKEKKLREAAFADEKHELENMLEDKKISQEQYNTLIIDMEAKKNADIAEMDKQAAKDKREKQKEMIDDIMSAIEMAAGEGAAAIGMAINGALTGVQSFLDILNTDFADGLKGTMDKINAYTQAIGGVLQSFIGAAQEASKERLDTQLATIDEGRQAEEASLKQQYENGLISKQVFEEGKANIDKAAKAKETAARKKAFEEDKKMKIASAVISGIQGAVAAFTGAMSLGPIAGPIVGGILAALVAGMTAVNVSKIKATQFEGGAESGGGAMAGGGGGGGGVPSAPTPPSISLQGSAMNGGEGSGLQLYGSRQTPMRSYVVESDITNTQNRLNTYQQRAEIG